MGGLAPCQCGGGGSNGEDPWAGALAEGEPGHLQTLSLGRLHLLTDPDTPQSSAPPLPMSVAALGPYFQQKEARVGFAT